MCKLNGIFNCIKAGLLWKLCSSCVKWVGFCVCVYRRIGDRNCAVIVWSVRGVCSTYACISKSQPCPVMQLQNTVYQLFCQKSVFLVVALCSFRIQCTSCFVRSLYFWLLLCAASEYSVPAVLSEVCIFFLLLCSPATWQCVLETWSSSNAEQSAAWQNLHWSAQGNIVLKCAETDCAKVCRDRSAQGNIVLECAETGRLCWSVQRQTDCVKVCRHRQISSR